MKLEKLTIRERFDRLRQAMRWSWKDIDTITGRKNSCSNIAKRVPAWSKLAITVHESYETLLHSHLLEIIALRLGRNWKSTILSGGVVMFIGQERAPDGELEWMDLSFNPGEALMTGNTSQLSELVEQLRRLYPAIEDVIVQEEKFTVCIPFLFETMKNEKNK
jgi:hypothetical protein